MQAFRRPPEKRPAVNLSGRSGAPSPVSAITFSASPRAPVNRSLRGRGLVIVA